MIRQGRQERGKKGENAEEKEEGHYRIGRKEAW